MRIDATEASIVNDGCFLLDGGTMFGVIPQVLWSKLSPPDDLNRIRLGLNCVLLRASCGPVLIEGGIGRFFTEKENEIFGVSGPSLYDALTEEAIQPEEVRFVVLTHLHFDHAGATITFDNKGDPVPFFQNASYIVQRREWEDAMENYGVMKNSYRPEVLKVLKENGNLTLIDGEHELSPEIELVPTGGHTRGHQIVILRLEKEKIIFPGDIIPMAAHLKSTYISSYDLFPMDTLRAKEHLLSTAARERAIMVFYHEPEAPARRIGREKDGKIVASKSIS